MSESVDAVDAVDALPCRICKDFPGSDVGRVWSLQNLHKFALCWTGGCMVVYWFFFPPMSKALKDIGLLPLGTRSPGSNQVTGIRHPTSGWGRRGCWWSSFSSYRGFWSWSPSTHMRKWIGTRTCMTCALAPNSPDVGIGLWNRAAGARLLPDRFLFGSWSDHAEVPSNLLLSRNSAYVWNWLERAKENGGLLCLDLFSMVTDVTVWFSNVLCRELFGERVLSSLRCSFWGCFWRSYDSCWMCMQDLCLMAPQLSAGFKDLFPKLNGQMWSKNQNVQNNVTLIITNHQIALGFGVSRCVKLCQTGCQRWFFHSTASLDLRLLLVAKSL